MLPPEEIAQIEAKIAALERSRKTCGDTRIRAAIEHWIKEQKDKLKPAGRATS
jgi:hypothetical protein